MTDSVPCSILRRLSIYKIWSDMVDAELVMNMHQLMYLDERAHHLHSTTLHLHEIALSDRHHIMS